MSSFFDKETLKTLISSLGIGALGFLGVRALLKMRKSSLPKCDDSIKNELKNTIFMVDCDIDDNSSAISKLFTAASDAFSNPNTIKTLISKIPSDQMITLVIETNGGALSQCDLILRRLKKHTAGYRVIVPGRCYSAGSIICLGAQSIVMDDVNSNLGKIDPISGGSQVQVIASLEYKYITDRNIIRVLQARNIMNYTNEMLDLCIKEDGPLKKKIKEVMLESHLPHEKYYSMDECIEIGLPVRGASTSF